MELIKKRKPEYIENNLTEPIAHMLEHRLPWLVFGLLGGLATSVAVSHFADFLSADVRLAFFIPLIVYISDAVGTQTETIYVRNLALKKINFRKYLLKETAVGIGLGIIFGVAVGGFAVWWLKAADIGLAIGMTMLVNLSFAPILAVMIPNLLYKRHSDPALGAGPVATVIQDLISLLVYFLIALIIIFRS